MPIDRESVETVDPVYKDFMLALRPVVASRKLPVQITGIPEGKLYDASARKYGYDPRQFFEIVENLMRNGLIERDKFGFYSPTGSGEEFIRLLTDPDVVPINVPPLNLGV